VRGNFESKVAVNQLNGSPLSNFVGLEERRGSDARE